MVTKEQALEALNEYMRGGGGYGTVVEFIEQSQPVPEVGAMAYALGDALRRKHSVFLAHTTLVDLVRAMLAAAPKPGDGNA